MSLPIIDLASLGEPRRLADALGPACREIGFFYVTGHGISPALVAACFARSADFFGQSAATKELVSIKGSDANRGYAGIGIEQLDPARPGDAKESFNIGRELAADDADLLAGTPFHALNRWPALAGFRETMLGLFTALQGLCETLHRGFALDLGLAQDFFLPFIDRPLATLRLLHYPPHPGRFDGERYGAAPHTDYGNVTVLLQDDAGGLEVRARDGTWLDAPPIEGAFVCNIGDCLMRWSNDIYVSTPHRVVNRSGRDRYSIAFFLDPNADAPVACLPSCTGPGRPPLYPPTTGAAYLQERLDATYRHRQPLAS